MRCNKLEDLSAQEPFRPVKYAVPERIDVAKTDHALIALVSYLRAIWTNLIWLTQDRTEHDLECTYSRVHHDKRQKSLQVHSSRDYVPPLTALSKADFTV
jgi:hypothetical protein